MDKLCFEDIEVGAVLKTGEKLVRRDEAIALATEFDPQPFHLDDAAAAQTQFGRLAASGWHTASMIMRLMVDDVLSKQESLGAGGIDELRWHVPVYPGDRITGQFVTEEKRRSKSRPDMGLIFNRVEAFNQDGVKVMSYRAIGMIRVREPDAPFD